VEVEGPAILIPEDDSSQGTPSDPLKAKVVIVGPPVAKGTLIGGLTVVGSSKFHRNPRGRNSEVKDFFVFVSCGYVARVSNELVTDRVSKKLLAVAYPPGTTQVFSDIRRKKRWVQPIRTVS
jgi:hypothetical protein